MFCNQQLKQADNGVELCNSLHAQLEDETGSMNTVSNGK